MTSPQLPPTRVSHCRLNGPARATGHLPSTSDLFYSTSDGLPASDQQRGTAAVRNEVPDTYIIAQANLTALQREYARLTRIGARSRMKGMWPRLSAAMCAVLAEEVRGA